MLNLGPCDGAALALERLAAQRAQQTAKGAAQTPGSDPSSAEPLRAVARDFAGLFYSVLVKEMQNTVREEGEEDSAVKQSVRDFIGMFLPQVAAGSGRDALAQRIYEQLSARYGDGSDESA